MFNMKKTRSMTIFDHSKLEKKLKDFCIKNKICFGEINYYHCDDAKYIKDRNFVVIGYGKIIVE